MEKRPETENSPEDEGTVKGHATALSHSVAPGSYTKPLSNLDKNKLRAATQYLTGHCELNYHLNKYKPQSITKICPHCSMEEETINHFIRQCPMWFNRKRRFFNCYYTSVSEIADRFPLRKIVGYICSTNRFNQQ